MGVNATKASSSKAASDAKPVVNETNTSKPSKAERRPEASVLKKPVPPAEEEPDDEEQEASSATEEAVDEDEGEDELEEEDAGAASKKCANTSEYLLKRL